MKKALTIVALFIGFCFANTASAQSQDDVMITINNETSRADLWELRQSLAEQGINFEYHPEFNAERKLIGIRVNVSTEAGETAEFETALASNDQKVQIMRTTDAEGQTSLCVSNNCFE